MKSSTFSDISVLISFNLVHICCRHIWVSRKYPFNKLMSVFNASVLLFIDYEFNNNVEVAADQITLTILIRSGNSGWRATLWKCHWNFPFIYLYLFIYLWQGQMHHRVLSQCNTRLTVFHLFNKTWIFDKWEHAQDPIYIIMQKWSQPAKCFSNI